MFAVNADDAETVDFIWINLNCGKSHIGAGVLMLLEHESVIHFVDMIAGEDQHMFGLFGADRVDILINRIGSALVQLFTHPLHRRQYFDELVHLAAHDIPAFTDMTIQRESFVLRKNVNPAQIGVDGVGEGDVNNAIDPAEGNGRFRAVARERIEPLAGSSSQQNSQSIFHGAPASMLIAAPGKTPPADKRIFFITPAARVKTVDTSTRGFTSRSYEERMAEQNSKARPQPAFLFDLDGTLIDSVYQHVLAWREALEAEDIH